jgi:hypothetical protein
MEVPYTPDSARFSCKGKKGWGCTTGETHQNNEGSVIKQYGSVMKEKILFRRWRQDLSRRSNKLLSGSQIRSEIQCQGRVTATRYSNINRTCIMLNKMQFHQISQYGIQQNKTTACVSFSSVLGRRHYIRLQCRWTVCKWYILRRAIVPPYARRSVIGNTIKGQGCWTSTDEPRRLNA